MSQQKECLYEFGSFRLIPEEHLLTKENQPIKIPLKTFELLLFFVENNNQVISKETLMSEIWGETFVEDANLTVHISNLRKIFAGDNENSAQIETFPKKGYRFTAKVKDGLKENEHLLHLPPKENPPELKAARAPVKTKRKIIVFAGLVLILLILLAGFIYSRSSGSSAQINSIAVLPFVNSTGNLKEDYLADGMTETLINSLSKLSDLKVKARNSVFRYKDKDINPQTIGRELSAQTILFGRISQHDETLILSLELVDVQTGNIIWSNQYSRKPDEIVSLQKEMASNIADKIRSRLPVADKQFVTKNYTESNDAYQLYLKGRFYWNKRRIEDFRKAVSYFQQAIEIDPNYALAYSGLSDSYNLLSVYGAAYPQEMILQTKAAALKALSLDEDLAEAHASMGQYLANYEYKKVEAEQEFKRAIQINPSYASAYQWYGELLEGNERFEEARTQLRQAAELDPYSPIIRNILGRTFLLEHRYDEAIAQFKQNIEIDPTWGGDHDWLFHVYAGQERYAEAVTAYIESRTLLKLDPPTELEALQESFNQSGWKGFLEHRLKYLEEKSKHEYVRSFELAEYYSRLNEKDKAFAALDQAFKAGGFTLVFLKHLPSFDNLRSDPRYDELIRRAQVN